MAKIFAGRVVIAATVDLMQDVHVRRQECTGAGFQLASSERL